MVISAALCAVVSFKGRQHSHRGAANLGEMLCILCFVLYFFY